MAHAWSHGDFYWNELMTHDIGRAQRFYGGLAGWRFESMPMPDGTYWIAKKGGQAMGGFFEMKGADFAKVPEQWLPYVAVDDVDSSVGAAEKNGATICRAPFDVPQVGRIAILRAPGGAMVGWITPPRADRVA